MSESSMMDQGKIATVVLGILPTFGLQTITASFKHVPPVEKDLCHSSYIRITGKASFIQDSP